MDSVKDLYRIMPNFGSETKEPKRLPKIMLLFGAGASRPAGIPVIGEMTKKFLENPIEDTLHLDCGISSSSKIVTIENLKKHVKTLADLTSRYFQGKMDIELIMSLMIALEDPKFKTLFETTYPEIKTILESDLHMIKSFTEDYIRKTCENISKIDYLWPLTGISRAKPLDVFTLNYDATVEIFCEKNDIKYTDGFDPYWNTATFERDSVEINIYKLHGSLYWFRSKSGKTIRVPIKGLKIPQVKYLTDESVSGNNKLWLVIVDPHASQYKAESFSYDDDIASKVVIMDMGIEEALRERELHSYLSILDNARNTEEDTSLNQQRSQIRLDRGWRHALTNYQCINHHDRIKWIVERLSREKFTGVDTNFPETIEGIVCENALSYAIEYHVQKDHERANIWKTIFLEICIAIEYRLFELHLVGVHENNPVKKDELPFWCSTSGGGYTVTYYIEKMEKELSGLLSNHKSDPIKKPLEKLVETLKLITYKEPTENGGYRILGDKEVWAGYETKDLGIKKWATEIIKLL